MQSYLGLVNYCRKFIQNVSIICAPLFDLVHKDISPEEFKRRINEDIATKAFKEISKTTLLSLPKRDGKWILTTDASGVGVGAVLTQIQNGEEKLISFYSSIHNEAERKYSTTEQELIAIISAIKHFRCYLSGSKFLLRTDHKALVYLWRSKDRNNRLFRWAIALQEYDFELEYIKGADNFSDLLSRAFNCCAVNKKNNRTKEIILDELRRSEILRI